MCDSFVALPAATVNKTTVFAKSADCQVNEAHALVRVPHKKHMPGSAFKATHVVIPQVAETYEFIMSKSFWTWGGEIGVNEHGVAIGNEAVFTTLQKEEKQDGLMVIDMLRIGLERGRSARGAVEAITTVLEQFGQGGNCELAGNSHFDGAYLITDTNEAWILETAGRQWVAKKVTDSIGSISNMLSIGDDYDLSSLPERIHWADTYGDKDMVPKLGSVERAANSHACMSLDRGHVSVQTAFNALRHHGDHYNPAVGEVVTNICMHAGPGATRMWQACSAMAVEISGDGVVAWATATSGTCLSIFKPVFIGVDLPDIGYPNEQYDTKTLWWKHELLHRRVMADFDDVMPEIRAEFDALEAEFIDAVPAVRRGTTAEKQELVNYCFARAEEATDRWIKQLSSRSDLRFSDPAFGLAWQNYNHQAELAGMPA